MPLNAGAEAGYGSVAGAGGLPEGEGASETAPLLAPEPVYQWQPMNRQQLQAAAGGSGWRAVRCYLVVLFWLAWMAMLAVAVAIVVISPKPVPTSLKWWQKCLFYQIQPDLRSDAQAEGSESINAACERLPYLRSLGVGALILQGVFHKKPSPANLTEPIESLETKTRIQHLLAESNKSDLKVVLDICEVNLLGHQETVGYGNTTSNRSATDVLRLWLERGVSGFVICDTDPAYSVETLLEWRGVFEEFSSRQDERILVVKQTSDVLRPLNVSTQSNITLINVVLKSILPKSQQPLSAEEVAEAIETQLQTRPDDTWTSWTVGGEVSGELKRILLVLMMTLPGSPAFTYKEQIDQTWDEKTKHPEVALFSTLSHSKSREQALLYGSLTFLPFNTTYNFSSSLLSNSSVSSPPMLGFLRSWGCAQFLVLLNVWPQPLSLDPAWAPSLPETGVYVASTGMDHMGSTSLYSVRLQPYEAVVIKLFRPGGYS
ncbi:4F2 cell-surface antigen heavy chain [Fundulus heteroclitus]|uniref:4F2 cell-surface antigen heavy chain n=1 Tax=Fundulus heteroclitus TaxID=8078 RepID=UPI00165ADB4E|nr:4F2 cell-surface antigen heavy chain [Fundulus heteroclitus]XP_021179675.2 4F2 cell-surface antigen heavy chain [Fundulus heteroclitus]